MVSKRRRWIGLAGAAALAFTCGCATSSTARAAAEFDRPVPPDVPRNEVTVVVDLEPAQDCEERFDLALYADRGIDLIAWDDGVGSCVGRTVTIRFLPNAIDRQRVLDKVKGLARRMEQAKKDALKEGKTEPATEGAGDDRS